MKAKTHMMHTKRKRNGTIAIVTLMSMLVMKLMLSFSISNERILKKPVRIKKETRIRVTS